MVDSISDPVQQWLTGSIATRATGSQGTDAASSLPAVAISIATSVRTKVGE